MDGESKRGGFGGGRGGGHGGNREQGDRGGPGGADKPKKEPILDLSKYIEKQIRVKFNGGREVIGVLKGFDPLLNLVLDNTKEFLRDSEDNFKLKDDMRDLGLIVCRGPAITLICPTDGMTEIANPFAQES